MEAAYIGNKFSNEKYIYEKLNKYFKRKMYKNKNKYLYNFNNYYSLLRERLRFTYEIFLEECYRIFEKKNKNYVL